jgi:RNA polymerase sigma-70 factor (ECF subfamily)
MKQSGESSEGMVEQPDPSSENAELVRRARQGDEAAWEAVVHLHKDHVFRLAYLFLGDADDANDAAQETFIRAFLAFDRFDSTRPLRPWLLSICANLARNRLRSTGRFFNAIQKLIRNEPAFSHNEYNDQDQRWQSQTLWRAVQRLGPNDQQIVYLRYFLELPVEETAQAIGVATGTVKSRLHRALERLRIVVEQNYPELEDLWA